MYESSNYLILDDGRIYNREIPLTNPRKIKLTLKERIQTKFMNFIETKKAKKIEKIESKLSKEIDKYEKKANKLEEKVAVMANKPFLNKDNGLALAKLDYQLDTIYDTVEKLTTLSSTVHEGDRPLRLVNKMFKAIQQNCKATIASVKQVDSYDELEEIDKKANQAVSHEEKRQEMQPPIVEAPVVARQRPLPKAEKSVRFSTPSFIIEGDRRKNASNANTSPVKDYDDSVVTSIESSPRFVANSTSSITVSSVEDAKEQGDIVNNRLNAASQEFDSASQRLESAIDFAKQSQMNLENMLRQVQVALTEKNNKAEQINKKAAEVNSEASKYESRAEQLVRQTAMAEQLLNNVLSMDSETEISRGRKVA